MQASIISKSSGGLDQRSRDIFKLIVENYLAEGEPVGSRNLSRILPQSLSPATIRNVMSDLENLGLVYAPHVSAGRMPTQAGLRFFVDGIMEVGDLSADERRNIETQIKASGEGKPVENLLTEASQMLSGLSRGAGLVLATKSESPLKHIEFIRLEPAKALAVLVSQSGDVENRILGIFTDGDLRRMVEKGLDLRASKAGEVMHPAPHAVRADSLAVEAVALMERHRITSVLVVDREGILCGALNTNDLMRAKVI